MMQEQQHLTEPQSALPRSWKLTMILAGGMFLVVGVILLTSHVDVSTVAFFSSVVALASAWQGQAIIELVVPRAVMESWLSGVPQRKQDASKREEEIALRPEPEQEAKILVPLTPTVKLNDRGEHDELLHLGVVAETREPLVVHANRFFGKGILVSGVPECGKSNLAALLIEQMGKCYIPSVVFDYKHEYASLVGVVPNGIQAGYGLSGPGLYNLTVENAAEFARDVMENGFQAIVDLQSYETLDNMAMVMAAVVNGLLSWSKQQPDNERTPCFVFEDEAHLFFPQNQSFTTLSKEVANMLGQSHFQLVTIGRSYGYTPAFFTQRLANIVKWLIATCQIKIHMRHSADVDLDRCMEEVKDSVATREMIENMPQGQGVVSGLGDKQFIAHFAERKSYHASHTPDIKRAHQRYRDGGTKTAILPEMKAIQNNPLWTAPQLPQVERPVESMAAPRRTGTMIMPAPKMSHRERYAKSIATWEQLERAERANMRNFAEATGLSEARAYKLLCDMVGLDLIHWERKKTRGL